ncbi:MAG TPA: endonuclease MutS2, partial [Anaerolineae bacterium]|nr:endonuclease MutS2 [Anaerolineae bacterium]
EYDKILSRLAEYTSFSAGREMALSLLPSDDLRQVEQWQAETTEARRLLGEKTDVHLGGVHDVRPFLLRAERGGSLLPNELLDIHSTLRRAASIRRTLTRLSPTYPNLADIAYRIEPCEHVAAQIAQAINERGEVMDSASPDLARIRRDMKIAQDRLISSLQRMIANPEIAQYLQEPLITQRGGRFVIPVKAEYKGRVQGLVHDQSASGATFFIEPLVTVEQNNRWRELQLEEEKEIHRILRELADLVGEEAPYIRRTVEALAELDVIFAKARYADALRATQPQVVPFRPQKPIRRHNEPANDQKSADEEASLTGLELLHPGSVLDLKQARHPLLDPDTVVPIDVHLADDYYALVITGPNTGGKTVTLKTVGLLTLMAQTGMHIPAAEGSTISCFEGVYADIGDEQSIEQSLSTFSSHMNNIISILEEADNRSLVLLDELGAGTDPEEGSALARALLSYLLDRGITTLATTHYSDLKVYAHATPGVRNASVEFDLETLAPTYELSIGLPGRSNALAIAARLGLDPAIIAAAESLVRPEALETEAMLADIKAVRERTRLAESEAELARRQAEALMADLRYRLSKIEEARRQVLNEAREQARAELEEVRSELRRIRKRLAAGMVAGGPSLHTGWLKEAEQALEAQQRKLAPVAEDVIPEPAVEEGPLGVGDQVWIPSLQTGGEVTEVSENGEVEVRVGAFRLKLPVSRVELRQRAAVDQPEAPSVSLKGAITRKSPGMELDLRGQRVEEVLPRLEKYLDDAYLAGLPWVRIIHGKGTGTLRRVVRDELRRHPLVAEFRPGESGEGGEGVTVARLAGK